MHVFYILVALRVAGNAGARYRWPRHNRPTGSARPQVDLMRLPNAYHVVVTDV
jgi:hypothetical protein